MKKWVVFLVVVVFSFCIHGLASALPLLFDNFDSENGQMEASNYRSFQNWDVLDGDVDLAGSDTYGWNFWPGNGMYVDLDGCHSNGGMLISKQNFSFDPDLYYLLFKIGGNPRFTNVNTVVVKIGDFYTETITGLGQNYPFTTLTREINIQSSTSGKLSFEDLGADNIGALLDNIILTNCFDDLELANLNGKGGSIYWPGQTPYGGEVPEPATISLLGLGLLGLVSRRKRS